MRTHLRLGRLLGVPIGVNGGVLVVSVLLAFSLAEVSLPNIAPRFPTSAYWFGAFLGVIGFMVSLVGHELGHSYVAQRNGVHVVEITLWLFGGVAKLEGDADDPGAEFRIAAAGPAMSMVMAVIAGVGAWGIDRFDGSRVLIGLLIWLAAINVVLAVSNLLPAFPLDGGRMLRAFLWRRSGRKRPATRMASMIGQVLAVAMVVGAIVLFFPLGDRWSGAWIFALGLFLFVAARSQWKDAADQPELLHHPVGELQRELPTPLGPGAPVAELERLFAAHPRAVFVPVLDDRGAVGALVTRDAVARIPPAHRGSVPVRSLAEPLVALPRVHPTESVESVVGRLGRGRSWWALVVDGRGVEGVLCSEDVDAVLDVATS
ncbi:site-2 protease family protein [Dermatobacter hominis]|uniref:site-2 protease family protein n=1 Tax=Dermatobacter hominis TaxID=2884263 RepID=UPI001D12ECC4|nr:site-2 protease family protein [Dermatobacter hominis]UDY35896.1 site-2 protease family protein [Dermatobacter hominis]